MRRITNVDEKRGKKKAIWFVDTAREVSEAEWGGHHKDVPSRYGPNREYVANCTSVEYADEIVRLWNEAEEDWNGIHTE